MIDDSIEGHILVRWDGVGLASHLRGKVKLLLVDGVVLDGA